MVDLDSFVIGPFLHWAVHNIPVNVLARGYHGDDKGYMEFPWKQFLPLSPTGTHRYTFFTFCQDNEVPVQEPPRNLISNFFARIFFDIEEFQKSHSLGDPVACNFFKQTLVGNIGLFSLF
nr:uncharacterized protein LOC110281903 [Parasteatoda tepidariorum]